MSIISITKKEEIDNLLVEKNTGEILEDINPRTKKQNNWNQYKKSNQFIGGLLQEHLDNESNIVLSVKRVEDINQCADTLIFLEDKEKNRKLHQSYFCKFRLCPVCNWRRSLKMFAQVSEITNYLMMKKPNVRFIFLTLTIKNPTGEELSKTIDFLLKKVQFIYSKSYKIKELKDFKDNLIGGLRALEVTYNKKDDTYHPHLHLLLAVEPEYFSRNYISQKKFTEIWQKILGVDYTPIVDVRKIHDATAHTVAEVSKYPIKSFELQQLPHDKAMEVLFYLMNASYNRRFVSFFGEFKKIRAKLQLDDIESGDLVKTSADDVDGFNAVSKVMFTYRADVGMYIC
jgi:plasmid rolling circle replication initiator protein Rep